MYAIPPFLGGSPSGVGQLTEVEVAERGSVGLAVYRHVQNKFGIIFLLLSLDSISYFLISRKFFDCYGPLLFFGSIVSYVVYIGFQLGGNFWLTVWTSDPRANTDTGVRDKYLGIFGLLGIFQVGL